jgi:hypothetical protein
VLRLEKAEIESSMLPLLPTLMALEMQAGQERPVL